MWIKTWYFKPLRTMDPRCHSFIDCIFSTNFQINPSFWDVFHCVKSVQIRSYFWSVFSCIRTEYGEILRYLYLDTFHAVFLPIYFLFFSNFLFFFRIKFRGTLDPPLVFSGCKMFLGEKVSFGLYFSFVIVYKIKWYIYKIKWYINKKCVDLLKKSLQISLRRNY